MSNQPAPRAVIERIETAATRFEVACGPLQRVVWRQWGQGRPLVLVHGGAGSWMHWIRNIEVLARDRRLLVPDLPGFGESDLPGGRVDADTIAPILGQCLRGLLRGEPFDLVGFSFGGLVSAFVAAERPANLERLVLVSAAGMGLLGERLRLRSMKGVIDPAGRREILRANLGTLMLHDPGSVDELAIEVQAHCTSHERAKNRSLARTEVLLALRPRWRCATFGIWGRNDALYRDRIDRLIEKTDQLDLRERVLLEAAGHWLPYECPSEFHDALSRFMTVHV